MDNERKIPTTTHAALLIELLGELGHVHDSIKKLPDALNHHVGSIVQATESARKVIGEMTAEKEGKLEAVIKNRKTQMTDALRNAIRSEVHAALEGPSAELLKASKLYASTKVRDYKTLIYIALGCALISGLGGFMGARYLNANLNEQADLGRKVNSVWQGLDKETQAKILGAGQR